MIVDALTIEMKRQGITLHPDSPSPSSIVKTGDGKLLLKLKKNKEEEEEEFGPFDEILFATGRAPLIEDLNLEKAHVKLTDKVNLFYICCIRL